MRTKSKSKLRKQILSMVLVCMLVFQVFPAMPASASDSLPWMDSAKQGENEPTVRGFTAQQIADWRPETQPYAELLRSRIPLQERIDSFADTQANPNLSDAVQLFTVMGDYGNSFMDNPAYTNKFGVYTFNFWQYVDYLSFWHGTATAYEDRELYDPTLNWDQRWFEIGCLNVPNPAWTDAAHKNGVLSLAQMFFSDNDRGMLTYQQMIVQDANGKFPVAEKLIEMAEYYGYDGYFFNQEETGARNGDAGSFNVKTEDFPAYRAFMARLMEAGLYINWYDAVGQTGSNTFARTINDTNVDWLYNRNTDEQISNSFFLDYRTNNGGVINLQDYLDDFNAQNGTDFTTYEVAFSGIEAGRDKFTEQQNRYIDPQLTGPNNQPYASIAMLGADFVHHELDSDLGNSDNGLATDAIRYDNDYQWMSTVRERFWWTGPNIDPANSTKPTQQSDLGKAVGADERNWPGVSAFIAERSVLGNTNFYTNFNTGRGLRWYQNGTVSNDAEWSNLSIQDVPVTWQWWQDTAGTKLTLDYDYGSGYGLGELQVGLGTIDQQFFDYTQLGGYTGGSSLVASGTLDAENFLHLYKTDILLNANHEIEMYYNKPSSHDSSTISLGIIFQDDPNTVVKVPLAAGTKTTGWKLADANLGQYAGKTIAALGLVFNPGLSGSIADWQVNIGSLRITDGSAVAPAAPTGLKIKEAYTDTNEVVLQWDMEEDYSKVKQYNIYVNNVFVGAKYDETYYIKTMPAQSGTIRVAPVGADGKEGPAAQISFDLGAAGVSGLQTQSTENGDLVVSWTAAAAAAGDVTVEVETRWALMGSPVLETKTVSAQSGTVTFSAMPVNGDYFTVRLRKAGQDALSASGQFIDTECAPYEGDFSWNGNRLYLPMPTTRDWRYLRVYEDGVERKFETTYIWDLREGIIRGRSSKKCLNFTSTAKMVWVVMEDYAGNRSGEVFLRVPDVDNTMFPDAVLRRWVLNNVGDNMQKVREYTGALSLDGLDIQDFTGLKYFANVTSLSVVGNLNIAKLEDMNIPEKVSSLNIGNTEIKSIESRILEKYPSVKEINITGMEKLELLELNGSAIENLVVGDAEALEALYYVDLRNTAIDVSAGSPARVFADYIEENNMTRGKVYEVYEPKANLAVDSVLTPAAAAIITDGNTDASPYYNFAEGSEWVLDFKLPVAIGSLQITMSSQNYVFLDATLLQSDNGTDWTAISTLTNPSNTTPYNYNLGTPVKARYLKMVINDSRHTSGNTRICEVTVPGAIDLAFPSAVYYDGKPVVDTTPLEALVVEAKTFDANKYTPASFTVLEDAIAAAETALAYTDPTIIQKEATACTAALQAAMANMMYSGSDELLIELAEDIWELYKDSESEYSPASWSALKNALEAAQTLAQDKGDNLTREEYANALKLLTDAVAALEKQDWQMLEHWYEAATELLEEAEQNGNYFAASVDQLKAAIAAAEAVFANSDHATQAEIDAAMKGLQTAIQQMQAIGNPDDLLRLIAFAGKLEETGFTAQSWQVLADAVAQAQALLAQAEASQEEYSAACGTMVQAISGLVAKAVKTELERTIAMAEKLLENQDMYTAETTENLSKALQAGKEVNALEDATQDAVNAAVKQIEQAIAGLAEKMTKPVLNTHTDFAYINGYSNGTVLPNAKITRAEVAQIFYNLLTDESRTAFETTTNSFSDVKSGNWANKAISTLANAGILMGDPNGKFRPEDKMSRAELMAVISRFYTIDEASLPASPFKDVTTHWAQKEIRFGVSQGWLNGYPDGSFKPNQSITRAETVKVLNGVLGRNKADIEKIQNMKTFTDNANTKQWYYADIQVAANSY